MNFPICFIYLLTAFYLFMIQLSSSCGLFQLYIVKCKEVEILCRKYYNLTGSSFAIIFVSLIKCENLNNTPFDKFKCLQCYKRSGKFSGPACTQKLQRKTKLKKFLEIFHFKLETWSTDYFYVISHFFPEAFCFIYFCAPVKIGSKHI